MASNSGTIQIALSNAYEFTNASNNDVVAYNTSTSNQILIGTLTGAAANLSIGSSNVALNVLGTTSNSSIQINTNNNATNVLTVLGTGNVGINTATPAYTLDVAGVAQTQADLRVSSNVYATNVMFGGLQISKQTGYNNFTSVSGIGYTFINASNIGINNATPATTLDIGGNLQTSANISASNLGMFRNRVINGDMRINQRGGASGAAGTTGTTLTTLVYAGVDRWNTNFNITTGAIQQLQVALTSSDTPFTYGFNNSVRFTAYTACSSYNYFLPQHNIEGYNISDWGWNGSSQGSSVTLSFWFRAAATGSYNYVISNFNTAVQSWVGTFSATAAIWAYYTFTIPPPTGTGAAWNANNNASALQLQIGSVVKTNTTATTNAWSTPGSAPECPTSGYVDWPATLNNYVEFTGVQIEKGTIATPFEFRPYQMEFQMCQRYYTRFVSTAYANTILSSAAYANTTTSLQGIVRLPVTMRVPLTSASQMTTGGTFQAVGNVNSAVTPAAGQDGCSVNAVRFAFTGGSGFTTGLAYNVRMTSASSYIGIDVEL